MHTSGFLTQGANDKVFVIMIATDEVPATQILAFVNAFLD